MIRLTFITHSTSLDNEAGFASGHRDVALSQLGERQAREVGERFAGTQVDTVFCSDLQRSFRTAEIAFADRGLPIVRDARLRECDYGDLTGIDNTTLAQRRVKFVTQPFPGGESYADVVGRTGSFLDALQFRHDGEHVVLVGHSATWFALEHLLRGLPLEQVVAAERSWQPAWEYELPPSFARS